MDKDDIFNRLFSAIEDRKSSSPEKSYVASLLSRGTEAICSKIIEESAEVVEAAHEQDHDHLIHEICDLLFHLFVLAGYKNISLDDIKNELERRFGIGGHEEKAGRSKK